MKRKCVAFYIRLSEADDDVKSGVKDESNSIIAQRELLYGFIKNYDEYKNAEVFEYFDDGISGTEFLNRKNFQKMLTDAGCGMFECILVKDFSRLGRDYIEVGNYLEFVFPTMGIRFISVNDNYDSEKNIGMTGGMDVAFRNLIYQLYSRDLSRKVKSATRNRNQNGEFTGAFPPYGYCKDKYDKHKLVIDEEIAPYIKEIFQRVIAGERIRDIARDFNKRKVPTRLLVLKAKCNYKPLHDMGDNLWDVYAIHRIIKKEAYTGKLIQNMSEIVGFGDNRRHVRNPKEKWTVVDDAIPSIISKEDFIRANEVLKRRIRGEYSGPVKRGLNLFVCGYCGRNMRKGPWNKSYICRMNNLGGDERCQETRINIEDAHNMVLSTAKEYCELLYDERKMHTLRQEKPVEQDEAESLLDEKGRLENSVIGLYKKYRAGDISKGSYISERNASKERIAEIEIMLKKKVESADSIDTDFVAIPMIPDEYDAGVLSEIIEKVIVYSRKRIEIVFKCNDIHREVCID